jgi:hypothetical protein
MCRDNAVCIATDYRLEDQGVGVRVLVGARLFICSCRPDRLWDPPNLLSSGYRGFTAEVKRPRREADHSPTSSAEVKKTWVYTSTPPHSLHGVVLNWLTTGQLYLLPSFRFNVRIFSAFIEASMENS